MTNREWLIEKIKTATENELAEMFVVFGSEYEEHDNTYYENILNGDRQDNYENALNSVKKWLKEEIDIEEKDTKSLQELEAQLKEENEKLEKLLLACMEPHFRLLTMMDENAKKTWKDFCYYNEHTQKLKEEISKLKLKNSKN